MWSGCGGNGNRFSTKEECEHLCALEQKVENTTDVCEMERDSGPCTDAVSQWYFSKEDGECRKFTYGGCRGNGNRFDTKEQCEGKCAVKSQNLILFDAQKVCALPFEKGPCSLEEKQFYFDIHSGRCRSFTYGGCDGNTNRFDSIDKCYQFCGNVKSKSPIIAEIKSSNKTFHVGDTVDLECAGDFGDDQEVVWFRNREPLELKSRYNFAESNRMLQIVFAKLSDSGIYSCSTGEKDATFEPVKLEIEPLPEKKRVCVDRGMVATCRLVVKSRLCLNPRYSNYCCESCKRASVGF